MCSSDLEIKNGLPYTDKEGHGFGVKSITMLVDRYKGYYSFSANEGIFTLKIVLPMVDSEKKAVV